MAGTCCHRCGRVHEKGTSCPKPYLTGAKSCKNRANEGVDEIFVGPRQYKTYMPDEWNYSLLIQLFDEVFGIDLQDETEGKVISLADLKQVLYDYGATHFQSKDVDGAPILPRLVKILKDKGHTLIDDKQAPVEETNEEKIKGADGKPCWKGYRYAGTENGKDKCVPIKEELEELNEGEFCPACLADYIVEHWNSLQEAEYKGRKVPLGKPMRGDVKKFKVYVKNKKGNVVKVNFGDPNMKIKKSNPKRRKSFRARHKCHTAKDRTTARYWSCRKW